MNKNCKKEFSATVLNIYDGYHSNLFQRLTVLRVLSNPQEIMLLLEFVLKNQVLHKKLDIGLLPSPYISLKFGPNDEARSRQNVAMFASSMLYALK